VVLVIRSEDEKIRRELDRAGVATVQNQQWPRGIGSSIRWGIQGLTNSAPDVEASVLLVCDQPAVDVGVIQRLMLCARVPGQVSSHQVMPISSVFPPSSPVPFLKSCFHLATRQARNRLFAKWRARCVIAIPRRPFDIDTWEDWKKLDGANKRADLSTLN
jgi:molybdenum cofactor cytidylyltransferase